VSHADLQDALRATIRDIPDFPQPGILFKDITPVLSDAALFRAVIARLAHDYRDQNIDLVVGIESRGFIFGAPLALELGTGFVPIRKPGKLPYDKVRVDYALEYGTDALEAHRDAIAGGQRILIVDDVLATGGTAAAAAQLVQQLGGDVAALCFVVELSFLKGRAKLAGVPVHSLIKY
jgi:adenine phosphoribosyltransferase